MTPETTRQAPDQNLSQELASYLTSLAFEDLPDAVVEKAKHQLTYFFGLAFAGHRTTTSRDARGFAHNLSPNGGSASIIGESFQVHPIDAAFANCSTVNSSGRDDVAFPPAQPMFGTSGPAVNVHPGLVTQPVAWALGEQQKSSGKDLLTAVVAGYEITGKLGALAWAPAAPALRRQIIPFGPFGSAAVAAKLLRLSAGQTATALGYAANSAMGISEGAVITHYYSLVCRNGIMAALLASGHADIASSVLEGERGFFRTFFGENPAGLGHLIERLEGDRAGGHFEILNTSIKTHPGTGGNIVPLEIMRQVVEREDVKADDVDSIELYLPEARAYHTASQLGGPYSDSRQATLALPFMFAIILHDGWLNPERFEQFNDPELLEMARRVTISFEPRDQLKYARVTINTREGRAHTLAGHRHLHELPADHLTWLKEQNDGLVPDDKLTRLADTITHLEDVEDVCDVMACVRRESRGD